jgi:hypothetical protein
MADDATGYDDSGAGDSGYTDDYGSQDTEASYDTSAHSDNSGGWLGAAWGAVEGAVTDAVGEAAGAGEAIAGWAASEVTGTVETAYHAGAGVYDMATGDWDGGADQMGDMANSALNVVTGGALGAAESGWDAATAGARAAGASDEEAPTSEEAIHHGLKAAGEWLGDEAYTLIHGDDSSSQ